MVYANPTCMRYYYGMQHVMLCILGMLCVRTCSAAWIMIECLTITLYYVNPCLDITSSCVVEVIIMMELIWNLYKWESAGISPYSQGAVESIAMKTPKERTQLFEEISRSMSSQHTNTDRHSTQKRGEGLPWQPVVNNVCTCNMPTSIHISENQHFISNTLFSNRFIDKSKDWILSCLHVNRLSCQLRHRSCCQQTCFKRTLLHMKHSTAEHSHLSFAVQSCSVQKYNCG